MLIAPPKDSRRSVESKGRIGRDPIRHSSSARDARHTDHARVAAPAARLLIFQYWFAGARSSCGCGFASPVVPGAASLLTLCVLTCSNVVTEATTTTTPRATANKISAVRCLFMDKPPRATPASVGSVVRDRQGPAPGGCWSSLLDCSARAHWHRVGLCCS